MTDAFPHPTRTERRGEFPEHPDPPPGTRLLTRDEALTLARQHLADWVADRDHRVDYGADGG